MHLASDDPRAKDVARIYKEYKEVGGQIYAELDPEGLLENSSLKTARSIIPDLVRKVPEGRRGAICKKLDEAVNGRRKCAEYFESAAKWIRKNHETYIEFLMEIREQLGHEQQPEENTVLIEAATNLLKEVAIVEDKEADHGTEDTASSLTPAQVDFLNLLEIVMALTEKAASLWADVAQHKLPSSVAFTLSNIQLREAENMIQVEKLLAEESGQSKESWKPSTPWAPNLSEPQLRQDWVDGLNEVSDAGDAWHKLVATAPLFSPIIRTLLNTNNFPDRFPHLPHSYHMLRVALLNAREERLVSAAQIPFVGLIGTYFCTSVFAYYPNDMSLKGTDAEPLRDERVVLCTKLDNLQALLPLMASDKCLTKEAIEHFYKCTDKAKKWVECCLDPVGLGYIHSWVEIYLSHFDNLVATNSVPLQIFLYQCEMLGLEGLLTRDPGYEHLLGNLMNDSRVATLLLRDGRPTTSAACEEALTKWCIPTMDDGIPVDILAGRTRLIEKNIQGRVSLPLSSRIAEHQYGLPKEIRELVSAKEGDDPDALRRYLIWEMGAPKCLELETALLKTLRELPEWDNGIATAIRDWLSNTNVHEQWTVSIATVINHGIEVLAAEESKISKKLRKPLGYRVSYSLEISIIKLAMKRPEGEESLKAELEKAFPRFNGTPSFADALVRATREKWPEVLEDFKIESLSRENRINRTAAVTCLMSLHENRNQEKIEKIKKIVKSKAKQRRKELELQALVVEPILEAFFEKAKPILERAYGERPGTLAEVTESMV